MRVYITISLLSLSSPAIVLHEADARTRQRRGQKKRLKKKGQKKQRSKEEVSIKKVTRDRNKKRLEEEIRRSC